MASLPDDMEEDEQEEYLENMDEALLVALGFDEDVTDPEVWGQRLTHPGRFVKDEEEQAKEKEEEKEEDKPVRPPREEGNGDFETPGPYLGPMYTGSPPSDDELPSPDDFSDEGVSFGPVHGGAAALAGQGMGSVAPMAGQGDAGHAGDGPSGRHGIAPDEDDETVSFGQSNFNASAQQLPGHDDASLDDDEGVGFGSSNPLSSATQGHGSTASSAADDDEAVSFTPTQPSDSGATTGPAPTPRPTTVRLNDVLHGEGTDAHYAREFAPEPSQPGRLNPMDMGEYEDLPGVSLPEPMRSLPGGPLSVRRLPESSPPPTPLLRRERTLRGTRSDERRNETAEEGPEDEMFSRPTPVPTVGVAIQDEDEVVPASPSPTSMEVVRNVTLPRLQNGFQRRRQFESARGSSNARTDETAVTSREEAPPAAESPPARERIIRPEQYPHPQRFYRTSMVAPEPSSLLSDRPYQQLAESRRQRATPGEKRKKKLDDRKRRSSGKGYDLITTIMDDNEKKRTTREYIAGYWEMRAQTLEYRRRYGRTWARQADEDGWLDHAARSLQLQETDQDEDNRLRRLAMQRSASENDIKEGWKRTFPDELVHGNPLRTQHTGFKRRADSVAPFVDPKRRKKEHKKFTFQEEAEENAAADADRLSREGTPGPEDDDDTSRFASFEGRKPVKKLVLHGPKAKPDGNGETCIVCRRPKQRGQAEPCSKCGRRKFCSVVCKNDFKEEYCCDECREEYSDDGDGKKAASRDKGLCILCQRNRNHKFEYGFSCRYCGSRRFCSELCREGYGFAHCSPQCADTAGEAAVVGCEGNRCEICNEEIDEDTAVPCPMCKTMSYCSIDCKDAQDPKIEPYCSETCIRFNKPTRDADDEGQDQQKGELSILADPRNYGAPNVDIDMPDLVANSESDEDSAVHSSGASIIDHRLVPNGSQLQYRIQTERPKTRKWEGALSLKGNRWTAMMRSYWAQDKRQRQRKYLEGPSFANKPAGLGRHVLRMEIEDHRSLLFQTLDLPGADRKGQTF